MAQIIKNPYYKNLEQEASKQPSRSTRYCLNLRPACTLITQVLTFTFAACLIFVMFTKTTGLCFTQTPYALCIANRHCAFVSKHSESYIDLLPFIGDTTKCVKRTEYQEFLYKGVQSTMDFVNWLKPQEDTSKSEDQEYSNLLIQKAKELILGSERQRQKLVSTVKYYYDEELGLHVTRYELGIWLLFLMMYGLRKALEKCGQRKTIFDFMHNGKATGYGVVQQDGKIKPIAPSSVEEIRKARESALGKKGK